MASRTASIITSVLLLLLVVPSSSSLKFDLHGSIHPGGYIYVSMKIGDQVYNLDVDTGSILTWLQCDIPNCKGPCKTWPQQQPLYKLKNDKRVSSMDPLCVELLQHPGQPGRTCEYNIAYAGESSDGLLIRDKLTLPIARNAQHTIAFGCGYNQQDFKPGQTLPVNGILGLGRGSAVNLAFQLKKENVIKKDVISHCISSKGGGFLFIGDYKHPNKVEWVTMDRNANHGHYSPAVLGELCFKGKWISKKPMKVVFDSGSTYTYFDQQQYKATEDEVIGSLHKSLTKVPDNDFKLCWKGTKKFKSVDDVKPLFKPIFLIFRQGGVKGSKATLDIPPENYLVIKDGNVCFGILHDPRVEEINLIGDITMQDRTVIYDNEAGQIGWVHDSCKGRSESSVIPSRL